MKRLLIAVAALSLASCTSPAERDRATAVERCAAVEPGNRPMCEAAVESTLVQRRALIMQGAMMGAIAARPAR